MTLAPIYVLGPVVTLHAFAAFVALALGASQLILAQRGVRHKTIGYIWVGLMATIALSSFWIHEIRLLGPFSPIHLLSLFTLVMVYRAVMSARKHAFAEHRSAMRWLFFAALIGAGAFTFLPGRALFEIVAG